MKSWISFLMPEDEYKEKKMLYFLAEGAVVLVLFLGMILIINHFIALDTEFMLFAGIAVFLLYTLARYIMSGMEYAEIATKKQYKREIKALISNSASFAMIYALLYLIYTIISNNASWYEFLVMGINVGVISFLFNLISLKRSYKKNKELL
ncbi:hypothetical protein [Oceanobacillus jeddahense]|uniref:hypothetical protein n=1 Tax=Oceanobacillus jeddahense TaxID=1462527 RepID=UPI000595EE36|nr:hypothetical protein [Oceanobacillus jeddahense]